MKRLICQLLLLAPCALAYEKSDKRRKFDARVGLFSFTIDDDRLKLNASLDRRLGSLYDRAYEYYLSYDAPPSDEAEVAKLTTIAAEELEPEQVDTYVAKLLHSANSSATLYRQENPNDPDLSRFDIANYFLDALESLFDDFAYWGINPLMGVGWSASCSGNVNDILATRNEWEKAGSGGATTLMALVPAILSFGNL